MHTREYQNELMINFRIIFGNELVKKEWDSVKYDPHFDKHKTFYAPRHDIAIGPFNTYWDLDIGTDKTKSIQSHPFTKRLYKDFLRDRDTLKKVWNSISLCYLAVEIEFSGSSKQLFGSIVNAAASGSIGIVIVKKTNIAKAIRIVNYIMRLEEFGKLKMNMLRNLIVFEDDGFLKFLLEYKSSL